MDWEKQLSIFRSDELFTFLACLNIEAPHSTNAILSHATDVNMVRYTSITESANLNALKLSGNHLELVAAFSCMEASHHSAARIPVYSLCGQNRLAWVHKISANCCLMDSFKDIEIKFTSQSSFDIETRLHSSVRIPFLQRIKDRESIEIDQRLNLLSAAPVPAVDDGQAAFPTGVFASQYEQTADCTRIDVRFKFVEYCRESDAFESKSSCQRKRPVKFAEKGFAAKA